MILRRIRGTRLRVDVLFFPAVAGCGLLTPRTQSPDAGRGADAVRKGRKRIPDAREAGGFEVVSLGSGGISEAA